MLARYQVSLLLHGRGVRSERNIVDLAAWKWRFPKSHENFLNKVHVFPTKSAKKVTGKEGQRKKTRYIDKSITLRPLSNHFHDKGFSLPWTYKLQINTCFQINVYQSLVDWKIKGKKCLARKYCLLQDDKIL